MAPVHVWYGSQWARVSPTPPGVRIGAVAASGQGVDEARTPFGMRGGVQRRSWYQVVVCTLPGARS
eukprot:4929699-Prymnesium_polylepis.1